VSLPLRARLSLWYGGLLAVILVVVGAFLVARLRADLVRSLDQSLSTRAAQIAVGLSHGCEGEFRDVSGASLTGLPQGEASAQLLAPDGSVMESSGAPIARSPLLDAGQLGAQASGESLRVTKPVGPDAEPFRILAFTPSAGCDGTIVVAASMDDADRSVHRLLVLLLIACPAALAAAAIGGWFVAGRALRPVARMTEEARSIGASNLDSRVEVPRTADELERLGRTLNGMLDRVRTGVEDQRRFIADASHELRTPLAIMTSELDVALGRSDLDAGSRDTLLSAREEVDRMRATVEDLLTLARLDEGALSLAPEPLDLLHVASDAVLTLDRLARERAVRLVEAGDPVEVIADRALMFRVISNLIGNALRYAPRASTVDVVVSRFAGGARLAVSDRGPGIDPEALEDVFDRYFRADASSTGADGGSGLGLAICRGIIEAHGGRIWAASRAGGGTTFTLELPAVLVRPAVISEQVLGETS
jgi:heavy metal sensor kinase